MKKFLIIFPSHPHSQNYTVSPNSKTVSQGHFQRSNQHFIAGFFPRQTLYAAAVSLIWGKLQKLGYHCLYSSALLKSQTFLCWSCWSARQVLWPCLRVEHVQGSCLCQQEKGPAIPSSPLADLTSHLWKWTDSAQQNLQPAVQKCIKRH